MVRSVGSRLEVEVPARPGAPPARQLARVGVQDGLVRLVGDRAEHLALGAASGRRASRAPGRSGRRRSRGRSSPARRPPATSSTRSRWRRIERTGVAGPDAVGERRGERLDVAARAPGDRAPARPAAQREHAVVVEELGQEAGRELPHLRRVGRPDRRGLRHDQPVDERARVAAGVEELAQRRAAAVEPDQRRRLAVEAQQVGAPCGGTRADQVRAAGEQPVRARSRCTRSRRRRRPRSSCSTAWSRPRAAASRRSKPG